MNQGGVSIIFSGNCSAEEKSRTLQPFEGLRSAPIAKDGLTVGKCFFIQDFNNIIRGKPETKNAATQTIAAVREGSPSLFEDFSNTKQLYTLK